MSNLRLIFLDKMLHFVNCRALMFGLDENEEGIAANARIEYDENGRMPFSLLALRSPNPLRSICLLVVSVCLHPKERY